jgi:FkbM family methyltransferase
MREGQELGFKKKFWTFIEKTRGFEKREAGSSKILFNRSGAEDFDSKINLYRTAYELELKSLFKACQIDLVLDVGANKGDFPLFLRERIGYSGRIIGFEPVAGAFLELQKAAAKDPLWQVFNLALGSRNTRMEINVAASSEFSSFLDSNQYSLAQFGKRAIGSQKQRVVVRRLEDFLGEISFPLESARIFLKIDTQGYDLEVYAGLGETLKHVAAMQSEVSLIPIYKEMPSWIDSLSFFQKQAFQVVGLFPVTREDLQVIELDCLLIKRAS